MQITNRLKSESTIKKNQVVIRKGQE